jgi:hypothetical protein
MKNPNRRWSWRESFKGATGGAANGAVTGAVAGAFVPDPTGASLATAAAIGALTGFVGSVVTDAVSYLWDDELIPFASRPLYNFVVGSLLSMPFVFVLMMSNKPAGSTYKLVAAIALLANAISTSSARLIDDIRARKANERELRERL